MDNTIHTLSNQVCDCSWCERVIRRLFSFTETEKYAHVTFFFNGGVEKQFEGETRSMVPSPKVATYDLEPEMNAEGVGQEVIND